MMEIRRNVGVLILLSIIRTSHQTVYTCDPSLSCGCSINSATVSRIVGGENASASTWNWAVSISIANSYLCTGSIISSTWVVTAAHCTDGFTASDITIFAGSTIKYSGTQTRVASAIVMHPAYNPSTYVNDIALLQLDPPLSMSDPNISTICLPPSCDALLSIGEWPAVGINVVAVGWGTLSEGGSSSRYLQQVTLQTVAYTASTCNASMHDWHVQLCAGVSGGGQDTCQGDSGGPMMLFTENKQWMLVGVTSNGYGCARPEYSGVYTRVAALVDWINMITQGDAAYSTTPVILTGTSSIGTTVSTASFPVISLDANAVTTTFFNVFGFVLLNLFITFFY